MEGGSENGIINNFVYRVFSGWFERGHATGPTNGDRAKEGQEMNAKRYSIKSAIDRHYGVKEGSAEKFEKDVDSFRKLNGLKPLYENKKSPIDGNREGEKKKISRRLYHEKGENAN